MRKKTRETGKKGQQLVSYSIERILTLRSKLLRDEDLQQFVGPAMDGERFTEFVNTLQDKLPGKLPKSLLRESLQHLAGDKITEETLGAEIWRLVGNLPNLNHGHPAPIWLRQTKDEWVPVQIVQMKWWRNAFDKVGLIMTARILAGSSAGMLTTRFFSTKFWQYLARQLGFARRRLNSDQRQVGYPLNDVSELVGMRFYVHVIKEMSVGKPVFTEFAVRDSMKRHNIGLMKKRHRVKFKCPKNYTHACWKCPIGYDVCLAAVHPRTYIKAACKICGNAKAWLDPQGKELEICVECRRKKDTTRKDSDK